MKGAKIQSIMTFWVAKMHDSWGFAAWNIESTHSFSKSKFLFTRLVLKYLKKGSARFLILSQWDILECKSFTLWEIASWLIGAYLKIQSLKCWEFSLLLQQWYLNSAVATKNCELLTQNYWDLICWEQRRPEQLRKDIWNEL